MKGETKDKGGAVAAGVVGMVGLAAVVALGLWWFFIKASKPLWEIGDVLWCWAAGDSGPFYVADRRRTVGGWEYHIWEGATPIDDLGRWTEEALLADPWVCQIHW